MSPLQSMTVPITINTPPSPTAVLLLYNNFPVTLILEIFSLLLGLAQYLIRFKVFVFFVHFFFYAYAILFSSMDLQPAIHSINFLYDFVIFLHFFFQYILSLHQISFSIFFTPFEQTCVLQLYQIRLADFFPFLSKLMANSVRLK